MFVTIKDISKKVAETVVKWRKVKVQKILLWAGIIIFAGFVGFGAQLLIRKLQPPSENKQKDGAPPTVKEIQDVANAGNDSEVDKLLAEKVQDPAVPGEEKYYLYQQQGSRFMAKGDATAAVDAYSKGFAINQTFEMAQAVAGAYWKAGDRQKAIEYYKKAIELVPEDNAIRDEEINSMNMMIRLIEEGK